VWCVNFHHDGGIYRGERDLHRLGEVDLAPGGGWPAGRVFIGLNETSTDFLH
jgi:hypothetical protein